MLPRTNIAAYLSSFWASLIVVATDATLFYFVTKSSDWQGHFKIYLAVGKSALKKDRIPIICKLPPSVLYSWKFVRTDCWDKLVMKTVLLQTLMLYILTWCIYLPLYTILGVVFALITSVKSCWNLVEFGLIWSLIP